MTAFIQKKIFQSSEYIQFGLISISRENTFDFTCIFYAYKKKIFELNCLKQTIVYRLLFAT